MAITKSRAAGLCLFCLLLTALEARADTNFATAITRGANYLVSSQNLDPGFGYWYEEGLTGEPVLGLTQAYRSQQNAGYLTSAQTGGSYVVYSEGQYNPGTTPHYSSAITGSGAYALEQLSERQANPASNEWRTELATFFSERRGNGTGTQDLINSLFQGGPLSYSLYDLARYTAAAYYVGATDASLFSNAIKTYLPTLTNADTGSPVLGLSASLWALAKTNMLSNTAFGDNLIKSDANYGSPFYQLTWNGLSAKVLSYQAPDGSFYNTFSRQNPDYTEVTAISTVALKAAYQQKPSLGYDQQIRSAQLALTGGLDSSGMAYQKLGDNTTVQANYLTGEVLEAMPDHTPTLKVYLTSTRVASGDYQVNVYAQILNGAAGEGLSDTSITIFSPTSAGVTVPKCDGDVETVWNSSLGSYLTIPATAKDYDSDGDADAVEMCLGATHYGPTDVGNTPILLATQTWTMVTPGRTTLSVAVDSGSRQWVFSGAAKGLFDSIQTVGCTVGAPDGDVNFDGAINNIDIDAVYAHFGSGPSFSQWDVNGDGVVNQDDVTYLLRTILHSNYGDTNLDQKVNFTDFQVLLDHWQSAGATWATGDFTGDHLVNFSDFQILLDYWNPGGYSQGVPEPGSLVLLGLGALGLIRRKK